MTANTSTLSNQYFRMADQFERAYYEVARSQKNGSSPELDRLVCRYYELEKAYGQAARSLGGRGLTAVHLERRQAFIRNLFFPSSHTRTAPTRAIPVQRENSRSRSSIGQQQGHQKIELSKLATVPAEEASLEGWGDRLMELEWLTIDGFGTIRNCMATELAFAGSGAPAWIVVGVPIMQMFGGLLCIHSAIRDTIPGAWNEWKKAQRLGEDEGKVVAGISLANQVMFATIGGALAAAGVVSMMGPTVANLLHYTPLLSSAAATTADVAISGIWGVTCLIRGGIMVGRGLYNLSYLMPFHDKLIESLKEKQDPVEKIEAGLAVLKEEWGDGSEKQIEHFKRRVGAQAAAKMEEYMKDPEAFTIAQKIELLEIVDRGIDTQKFKQYLIILIGLLMIAGAIACLVFSGGLAGVATLAAIGIAFALMESQWLVFDWTWLFNKISSWQYTRPDYIPKLSDIEESSQVESDVA